MTAVSPWSRRGGGLTGRGAHPNYLTGRRYANAYHLAPGCAWHQLLDGPRCSFHGCHLVHRFLRNRGSPLGHLCHAQRRVWCVLGMLGLPQAFRQPLHQAIAVSCHALPVLGFHVFSPASQLPLLAWSAAHRQRDRPERPKLLSCVPAVHPRPCTVLPGLHLPESAVHGCLGRRAGQGVSGSVAEAGPTAEG